MATPMFFVALALKMVSSAIFFGKTLLVCCLFSADGLPAVRFYVLIAWLSRGNATTTILVSTRVSQLCHCSGGRITMPIRDNHDLPKHVFLWLAADTTAFGILRGLGEQCGALGDLLCARCICCHCPYVFSKATQ